MLKQALGVEATLVVGRPGEFTVWLDTTLIAEKQLSNFPDPDDIVDDVRAALSARPG